MDCVRQTYFRCHVKKIHIFIYLMNMCCLFSNSLITWDQTLIGFSIWLPPNVPSHSSFLLECSITRPSYPLLIVLSSPERDSDLIESPQSKHPPQIKKLISARKSIFLLFCSHVTSQTPTIYSSDGTLHSTDIVGFDCM